MSWSPFQARASRVFHPTCAELITTCQKPSEAFPSRNQAALDSLCQLIKQKDKKKIPFRTYDHPQRTFQIQTHIYLCRNKTSKWQKPDKMIKKPRIFTASTWKRQTHDETFYCNVCKRNVNPILLQRDLTYDSISSSGFMST